MLNCHSVILREVAIRSIQSNERKIEKPAAEPLRIIILSDKVHSVTRFIRLQGSCKLYLVLRFIQL